MASAIPSYSPTEPYLVLENIHNDDIHGMCRHEGTIFTGSKDTTLRLFDLDTSERRILSQAPGTTHHYYTRWITALDVFDDGSLIAGSRNGFLQCLSKSREFFKGFLENPIEASDATSQAHYKPRNMNRITGICALDTKGMTEFCVLIGTPKVFYKFDVDKSSIISMHTLTSPDWIYGFQPLTPEKVAIIHAATFSIFQEIDGEWTKTGEPISEGSKIDGKQRPFISHIQAMDHPVHSVALALFGGEIKVVDIEAEAETFSAKGHTGRVWQTLPMSETILLSSADDRTVKLWDMRASEKCAHTFSGHPGRVSAMTKIDEFRFVAGTCPDNPFESETKAEMYFYDLRER
ncbi:MAG: hypothetical protein K9M07_05520 [Simkaniaceae bacterium]|nr:hypothetical protein [Simkaniaceae bacterium]MCF7852679.1 hypothetical protein [Simkaniaceae bacterium]